MEEAIADLHNAIHLALSLNPQDFSGGDDLLQNGVVPAESSSTTESRISSLSGSMIEQSQRSSSALNRLKLSLHNNSAGDDLNGGNNGNESVPSSTWQRHCLSTAKNVEHALSNYELALSSVHNGGRGEPIYFIGNEDGSHQQSIVDLLVAVLTSVNRHLMQQCGKHYLNGMMGSSASSSNFVTSMEQLCFTAACISANMLMKWFCQSDNFTHDIPLLEVRHVDEMIEEVAVASEDDLLSQFVEPIVTVVNSTLERQRIASSTYDEEGDIIFSNLSAKDELLLATSLMQRFICQPQDNAEVETSSHISLFISSLLENFRLVLAEAGSGQFEAWADTYNEYMERNLNDNEMANIPALVSQYHVLGIESALALLENAESLVESSGESENVESIITTVQDTIRASMIAISTTETMENLGMTQNPQIQVIFDPFIVAFTKFILSGLQKALDILRRFNCSHDIEGICNIADDLLFRLCCTINGLEFFKSGGSGEEEEILALVLLRAMSAGCIQSKAKALLDLAATNSAEVSSKRQRFNSSLSFSGGGGKPSSLGSLQKDASSGSMIDVLLCCLSLSQSGHVTAERSHIKEVSCITSALMFSDAPTEEVSEDSGVTVVDPLNPWHSLQLKPLIQLMEDENSSPNSNESAPMMESLIAYTSSLPPCADISSA
eukprot:CAMPEP_0113422040 /NCGR_PEP_ID=MMETSP0013_2-20120614/28239_1 /TAXON_ID=2843 ORGANISM="Skeletonema costatum, Strain 1716" /NCGR_SAMPLE_ID=MMETSP0013_2 /ASSEMBLY_ACC=CAM_ASM_000158 /LENGTH=664 /DNA_ID=CAMNT_0000309739 /DNA_START=1 /DNA_END=1993 /DNA_ORIENTATION=+ /assembly_acc=CAM_ASM_000158